MLQYRLCLNDRPTDPNTPLEVLTNPNNHLTFQKREAIDLHGFGAIMKIYLHFDEPFWGDGKSNPFMNYKKTLRWI